MIEQIIELSDFKNFMMNLINGNEYVPREEDCNFLTSVIAESNNKNSNDEISYINGKWETI